MKQAITIELLQAEHSRLGELIALFKQQPSFPLTVSFPKLNEGEIYIGTIINAKRQEHIILLPGENEGKAWQKQLDWAKSIGGELPDRLESALLFQVVPDEFEKSYHWLREEYAGHSDYAWIQYFEDGNQNCNDKACNYRARAVRRLPI